MSAHLEIEKPPDASPLVFAMSALRLGGAERVVTHLAGTFYARGIHPTVVCLDSLGPLGEELASTGVPVVSLDSHGRCDWRSLLRLRRLLADLRPRVINVHDRASLPYVWLANAMAGRAPLVYTAHGLLFDAYARPRLRDRLPAQFLSAMIAVSEEAGRRNAAYLGWKREFAVVPNGVPDLPRDDAKRRSLREQLGLGPDVFVFVAVGNARPEKGFEDLLEATALLRQEGPRPSVVLIGGAMPETPYCDDLRARHARLDLAQTVRFLGVRRDTDALYSAADAFVLSSRSEGLPMVLLEAMMSGLPLVATRTGGVPAVVREDFGILVDVAAPHSLAGGMRQLLSDPPRAATMGRRARDVALRDYSVDRMAARYSEVFDRICCMSRP
jgi:glycosyltransferase involved in cell wall biosynthesis